MHRLGRKQMRWRLGWKNVSTLRTRACARANNNLRLNCYATYFVVHRHASLFAVVGLPPGCAACFRFGSADHFERPVFKAFERDELDRFGQPRAKA